MKKTAESGRVVKPLVIGGVAMESNLILAPMAGITDLPFRLLCKEHGAGLVCMEMVSAKAILYGNKNTLSLLEIHPAERPVSLQLFGADPDIISKIAQQIEEYPFDILDLNMGCPVPKVVNNHEGAALMSDPCLAAAIIEKTVKAIKKPVTVKIRKGFNGNQYNAGGIQYNANGIQSNATGIHDNAIGIQSNATVIHGNAIGIHNNTIGIHNNATGIHDNAVEIGRIAEQSGAAAIAVHGRTREQFYSGAADWETIAAVKAAVKIPVIGSGDVTDGASAAAMLKQTGCDGVMIGRAARGNPWIFEQVRYYLEQGEHRPKPSGAEIREMIMRHAALMLQYKGGYTGIREMRKHVAWYTAGLPHAAKLRRLVNTIESFSQLEEMINHQDFCEA